MENKLTELKIPKTKILVVIASVILKFYCQLSGGLSQQGELLIVNFVGAMNSIWDLKIFNWTNQVEEISKLPLLSQNSNSEEYVKIALKWVVIMRIIIAHLYTGTYIANFYPILTLCRGKLLVPWLAMSALKNFILELIVVIAVIFLYLQSQIPFYLLCEFFIHKLVTLAPAIYNWLTINSFYMELKMMKRRKLERLHHSINQQKLRLLPDHPNIMLGLPMQKIHLNYSENLTINTETPRRFASLTNFSRSNFETLKKYRVSNSLSLMSVGNIGINFFHNKSEDNSGQVNDTASSSCDCSPPENPRNSNNLKFTHSRACFSDQGTIINVSSQSKLFHQNLLSKKIDYKYKVNDYTNLLNHYNDSESSRWSSDEEINITEFCKSIINSFDTPSKKKSIAAIEFDSNKWRKKLEITGSSFESTLQYYNQLQESCSSKSTSNNPGLSRSWILDGMIITGTAKCKKKSSKKIKNSMNEREDIEIEALKAYNKKTLWKDRMERHKLTGNCEKISNELQKCLKEKQQSVKSLSNIKEIIENLDWSLKTLSLSSHRINHNSEEFIDANNPLSVFNIVIDNTNNTIELLESAFGYSDRSMNGFNFGPTDIYSSPEIPNIFYEIIKTAMLRTIKHDCNYNCTADVDYGDNYWKELIELRIR